MQDPQRMIPLALQISQGLREQRKSANGGLSRDDLSPTRSADALGAVMGCEKGEAMSPQNPASVAQVTATRKKIHPTLGDDSDRSIDAYALLETPSTRMGTIFAATRFLRREGS